MKHGRGMTATISITQIPEALAAMRSEVARILREVAADEEPKVAYRLMQVADAFECGSRPGAADDGS